MTILAPKKSGQAAKNQEQEKTEQAPAHQAQQPPRSPQVHIRPINSFKHATYFLRILTLLYTPNYIHII